MSFAHSNGPSVDMAKPMTISPLSSSSSSPKVISAMSIPSIEHPESSKGSNNFGKLNSNNNNNNDGSNTNLGSTFANALKNISRRNSSSSLCSTGSTSNGNQKIIQPSSSNFADAGFDNELTSWMKNKIGSGVKLFENSLLAANNMDNAAIGSNSSNNSSGLFFDTLNNVSGAGRTSSENGSNSAGGSGSGNFDDIDDPNIETPRSAKKKTYRSAYYKIVRQVNKRNWVFINKENKCRKCQIRVPVLKKFIHLTGSISQIQLQTNNPDLLTFFLHNCMLCGFIFCQDHLRCVVKVKLVGKNQDELQVKKNSDTDCIPVRSCLKCFEEKFMMYRYNEDFITVQDKFLEFQKHREKFIEVKNLEQVKILRRLAKYYDSLVKIYESYYLNADTNTLNSFFKKVGLPARLLKFQEERRSLEKQYMQFWKDERTTENCNICRKKFQNIDNNQDKNVNINMFMDAVLVLYNRKHHCRLCGCVTCDDGCSMEIPIILYRKVVDELNQNKPDGSENEELKEYILNKMSENNEMLRICQNCKQVVFKRGVSKLQKDDRNELVEQIERMLSLKIRVDMEIPQLQDLLSELAISLEEYEKGSSDMAKKRADESISKIEPLQANITRFLGIFERNYKRLIELKDVQLNSDNERMLAFSSRAYGAKYLQSTAEYLKQLQKLLIERKSIEKKKSKTMTAMTDGDVKVDRKDIAKIKKLREELMILKEQEYLVSQNVEKCVQNRKLDEVVTLKENLLELQSRIEEVSRSLGDKYTFD